MNISLIGMMGSGKTTIGKLLTTVLSDFSFVDTDEEIVNLEKKQISDIFEVQGEEYFRNVESNILKNILSLDNKIVSTGGGIVKRDENIKLLKEKSIVIYLSASPDTLFNRIKDNTERPLLNGGGMQNKIKKFLLERELKYKEAHYHIDTEDKEPSEIVREIVDKVWTK